MAETDEQQNQDGSPTYRMVGTNPTAASNGTDASATTYITRTVYDTDTGRTLEYVQYEDVKKLLEDAIAKEEKTDKVKLDESFLKDIEYHIDKKDRDITVQLQLLSEQDTRYENFLGKMEMHYTFASSYEDSTSFAIKTGRESSVSIGGTIGARHGWNKGEEKGKGHAKMKNLTINGVVAPGECVTVKEVVHNVIKTAICDVELKISEDAQVPFTSTKKEWYKWYVATNKTRTTAIKRLLTDEFRNNKCVRVWNGKVEFHVRNEFEIEATEHTLEVYAHESEKTRAKRLKLAYENSCNKYASNVHTMAKTTSVLIQATRIVRKYLTIVVEYIKESFVGTAV